MYTHFICFKFFGFSILGQSLDLSRFICFGRRGTTNMLFTITMTDTYASTKGDSHHNRFGSMTSDLIVIYPGSRSITFAVTYVILPSFDGMNYKIHCLQLGLTGRRGEMIGKIPHQPMIDIVFPGINKGSTLQNIILFLQKLILVECGLHYQCESHSSQCNEYTDINSWLSIFSNVSRLVPVYIQNLDSTIERRKSMMGITQKLIDDKPRGVSNGESDVSLRENENRDLVSKVLTMNTDSSSDQGFLVQGRDSRDPKKQEPEISGDKEGSDVSVSKNFTKSAPTTLQSSSENIVSLPPVPSKELHSHCGDSASNDRFCRFPGNGKGVTSTFLQAPSVNFVPPFLDPSKERCGQYGKSGSNDGYCTSTGKRRKIESIAEIQTGWEHGRSYQTYPGSYMLNISGNQPTFEKMLVSGNAKTPCYYDVFSSSVSISTGLGSSSMSTSVTNNVQIKSSLPSPSPASVDSSKKCENEGYNFFDDDSGLPFISDMYSMGPMGESVSDLKEGCSCL